MDTLPLSPPEGEGGLHHRTPTHPPHQPSGREPGDDILEASFLPHHNEEDPLVGCESPVAWAAVDNLDIFFTRVYQYWEEKGFAVILTARILNIAALVFTVFASGMLLLWVDYSALKAPCIKDDTCNLWDVAIKAHPLQGGLTLWSLLACIYVTIFSAYCCFTIVHLGFEVRGLAEVRHFYEKTLGLSERALRAATWPEVAARLVSAQHNVRLCISRDLSEHDIVSRIMRRENYLIGMLNRGILALNVPFPGLGGHLLLTKTLEWNLYWCILDPMFDKGFRVKRSFVSEPMALRRRFRTVAVVNALLSPFLLFFLVIYFFMRNAEAIYHHPSSIGARRWSPLARWRLQEFNELPCFLSHRLNAGHAAAERYVAQFPNHALSHVARFVAFVAGSFAAVLIAMTMVDEKLLERDFADGRQTVWWLALLGVILAASRALIIEHSTASFDPALALLEVAARTHHYPRHWRGRAHTLEVQEEFETLFRYRVALFLEEIMSVVLTPVLLWHSLPSCAEAVVNFVKESTTTVEGVGDVCSLAAFDLRRHGNARYGSPCEAPKTCRSRQGKMEKSFISFAAAYPSWQPQPEGKELLSRVESAVGQMLDHPSAPDWAGQDATLSFFPEESAGQRHYNMNDDFGLRRGTPTHPILRILTSHYPHLAKLYMYQHGHAVWPSSSASQSFRQMAHLPEGRVFKSATAVPINEHSLMAFDGLDPDGRIAAGQALLQSYYDEHSWSNGEGGRDQGGLTVHGPTAHPSSVGQGEASSNGHVSSSKAIPPQGATQFGTAPQPMPAAPGYFDSSSNSQALDQGVSPLPSPKVRVSTSLGSSAARSPQVMSSELSVLSRQASDIKEPSGGG